MTQDIEIQIGELFLDRLPSGDPDALRAAIEAGLTQRIQQQGWPGRLSRQGSIDQMHTRAQAPAAGGSFGDEIAGLLYNGLANPDSLQRY